MDKLSASKSFKLPRGDGHVLHIEESGVPNGLPVLYMHGGPGAGLSRKYQSFFDLNKIRLIGFDQRGCGQSTPHASIENNTTEHLIADIEAIREVCNVDKWMLFGGSWGATLALVYAIKNPSRVSSIVLRGTFLARDIDFDWFIAPSSPAAQLFPEAYKAFAQDLTVSSRQEICESYFKAFTHREAHVRLSAALRWASWEAKISRLKTTNAYQYNEEDAPQLLSLAILECYYLMHDCFLSPNFILNNSDKISHLPIEIVHGQYDLVCMHEASNQLRQRLPNSALTTVEDAGHSTSEEGIHCALTRAVEKTYQRLTNKNEFST